MSSARQRRQVLAGRQVWHGFCPKSDHKAGALLGDGGNMQRYIDARCGSGRTKTRGIAALGRMSRWQAMVWDALSALTGGGVVSQIVPNLLGQRAAKTQPVPTVAAILLAVGSASSSAAEASSISV